MKVFFTDFEFMADKKVFVVEHPMRADKVALVVEHEHLADEKVFRVEHEFMADYKIFVEHEPWLSAIEESNQSTEFDRAADIGDEVRELTRIRKFDHRTADRVKELQREIRDLHRSKEFVDAFNGYFEARKAHGAQRVAQSTSAEAAKRSLVSEAGALDPADRALKDKAENLRERWKVAGRVPSRQIDDELWNQFKAGLDAAFARRVRLPRDGAGLRDLARRTASETKSPVQTLREKVGIEESHKVGLFKSETRTRVEERIVLHGWRLFSRSLYEAMFRRYPKPHSSDQLSNIVDSHRQIWLSRDGRLMTADVSESGLPTTVWLQSCRLTEATDNDLCEPEYFFKKRTVRDATGQQTMWEFEAWKHGAEQRAFQGIGRELERLVQFTPGPGLRP